MGTRCVVTFKDEVGSHSVYKHWDGYPEGILPLIEAAKERAWPLPRFEADDFAAAFVAVTKGRAGDVRLTHGPECHGDLEYIYEVTCIKGNLHITHEHV